MKPVVLSATGTDSAEAFLGTLQPIILRIAKSRKSVVYSSAPDLTLGVLKNDRSAIHSSKQS